MTNVFDTLQEPSRSMVGYFTKLAKERGVEMTAEEFNTFCMKVKAYDESPVNDGEEYPLKSFQHFGSLNMESDNPEAVKKAMKERQWVT